MLLNRWADCNLGRRNPHIVAMFRTALVNGRVIGTKRNYATCVLDFLRFCNENGEAPTRGPSLNVEAVVYWMQYRIWRAGSCNARATWSAALTWLCQSQGLPSNPPLHHLNPDYITWHKNATTAFKTAVKKKAPIHVRHIHNYIKNKLKIDPKRLHAASYDDLIRALCLTLIFLTMSRCMEVLWCDKTEDPKVRVVHTGVRWKHVDIKKRAGFRSPEVLELEIPWFKNQQDRTVPKHMCISSPCCTHPPAHCLCPYFDIFAYIREIYTRRTQRIINFKRFCPTRRQKLSQRQIDRLDVGPDNYLFVNMRGTILGYGYIYKLTQDLKSFNNIEEYTTPHSFRIGATSLAHHQCIDCLRCMRYVEWLPGQDPTMHAHYVQYNEFQLATIPYEMLHGTLQFGEPTKNYIHQDPTTFILRNEVIKATLYSGGKQDPALFTRAPVYDEEPDYARRDLH